MTKTGEQHLHVEYRLLEQLIPFARNARTHSDAHVAQIAASIREFGWTNPVLVDGENGIIAGHGRVLATRKEDALGYLWLLERLRRLWDASPAKLRKEAATWREHALLLASEAYALATAVESLAERYFGGHTPLFPTEAEGVAQATEAWDALLAMYTDQLGRLPTKHQNALALTPEIARAGGAALAEHDSRYVVVQAKAETLRLLGDHDGAALLVEPYL